MSYMEFGNELDSVLSFDPYNADLQLWLQQLIDQGGDGFAIRADLAATVQAVLTRCLLHCYELVRNRDFEVFAIAGGCALNTVANGVLAKQLDGRRRLVVPPCAGDAGIAFGSLWLDARERSSEPIELTLRGAPMMPAMGRPGRTYDRAWSKRAVTERLSRAAPDAHVDGPAALAEELCRGAVIGVFNGASEIGPRALGGRSILADPRAAETKERINRSIKQREPFRPLAPMVLAEDYATYFSPPAAASPFMLVVADASDECRVVAPAVVHIDGTARVQVVDAGGDPFLVNLLRGMRALNGHGILLNTSFNRRSEPIVETPDEAVDAFLAMGLDGLWLDGIYVRPAPTR